MELILKDIGNRHGSESPEMDQPDYDSVASDEDTEQEPTSGKDERTKVHQEFHWVYSSVCGIKFNCDRSSQSSESSDLSDSPITVQEFMEVKSALTASEVKIHQLLKVNCHLGEELRLMQSKVSSQITPQNNFIFCHIAQPCSTLPSLLQTFVLVELPPE